MLGLVNSHAVVNTHAYAEDAFQTVNGNMVIVGYALTYSGDYGFDARVTLTNNCAQAQVMVDISGSFYTRLFGATQDWGGNIWAVGETSINGGRDDVGMLLEFDENANIQTRNAIKDSSQDIALLTIDKTSDHGFICGGSRGSLTNDVEGFVTKVSPLKMIDNVLQREIEWTMRFGFSGRPDYANNVIEISSGNYAVAGEEAAYSGWLKGNALAMILSANGDVAWAESTSNGAFHKVQKLNGYLFFSGEVGLDPSVNDYIGLILRTDLDGSNAKRITLAANSDAVIRGVEHIGGQEYAVVMHASLENYNNPRIVVVKITFGDEITLALATNLGKTSTSSPVAIIKTPRNDYYVPYASGGEIGGDTGMANIGGAIFTAALDIPGCDYCSDVYSRMKLGNASSVSYRDVTYTIGSGFLNSMSIITLSAEDLSVSFTSFVEQQHCAFGPACTHIVTSASPSMTPSSGWPSVIPSLYPTTNIPTTIPSPVPSTFWPSSQPTKKTYRPTKSGETNEPTSPSSRPSGQPFGNPSGQPSGHPLRVPTGSPLTPTVAWVTGTPTIVIHNPTGQPIMVINAPTLAPVNRPPPPNAPVDDDVSFPSNAPTHTPGTTSPTSSSEDLKVNWAIIVFISLGSLLGALLVGIVLEIHCRALSGLYNIFLDCFDWLAETWLGKKISQGRSWLADTWLVKQLAVAVSCVVLSVSYLASQSMRCLDWCGVPWLLGQLLEALFFLADSIHGACGFCCATLPKLCYESLSSRKKVAPKKDDEAVEQEALEHQAQVDAVLQIEAMERGDGNGAAGKMEDKKTKGKTNKVHGVSAEVFEASNQSDNATKQTLPKKKNLKKNKVANSSAKNSQVQEGAGGDRRALGSFESATDSLTVSSLRPLSDDLTGSSSGKNSLEDGAGGNSNKSSPPDDGRAFTIAQITGANLTEEGVVMARRLFEGVPADAVCQAHMARKSQGAALLAIDESLTSSAAVSQCGSPIPHAFLQAKSGEGVGLNEDRDPTEEEQLTLDELCAAAERAHARGCPDEVLEQLAGELRTEQDIQSLIALLDTLPLNDDKKTDWPEDREPTEEEQILLDALEAALVRARERGCSDEAIEALAEHMKDHQDTGKLIRQIDALVGTISADELLLQGYLDEKNEADFDLWEEVFAQAQEKGCVAMQCVELMDIFEKQGIAATQAALEAFVAANKVLAQEEISSVEDKLKSDVEEVIVARGASHDAASSDSFPSVDLDRLDELSENSFKAGANPEGQFSDDESSDDSDDASYSSGGSSVASMSTLDSGAVKANEARSSSPLAIGSSAMFASGSSASVHSPVTAKGVSLSLNGSEQRNISDAQNYELGSSNITQFRPASSQKKSSVDSHALKKHA